MKKENIIIEPELLLALYYGNNYTTKEISNIFDCGATTIRKRLKKYNIPAKSWDTPEWKEEMSKRISKGGRKYIIEKELLVSLYWGNQYSLIKIANLIGCSECVITNRFHKFDIPTRSISEARKGNKYENAYRHPKGYIPWNKGKVGAMPTPWNKGRIGIAIGYWTNKERNDMKGENNPNWKGGVTPENELIRSSIEYKEWRNKVYKRDYWTCQICNKHCIKYNIVAHHIKPFAKYPELRFDINNGITLCRSCHLKLHKGLIEGLKLSEL